MLELGLTLLPIVSRVAPWLLSIFRGGTTATDKTLETVVAAVQKVFGTTDSSVVQRELAADQSKYELLRAELDSQRASLEAALKDVQSAREMTLGLAGHKSPLVWGAAVVSIIATLGFFGVLFLFFFGKIPQGVDQTMLSLLVGAMVAGYTTVLQFWLGSSQSSRVKDFERLTTASIVGQSSVSNGVQLIESEIKRPTLRRMS